MPADKRAALPPKPLRVLVVEDEALVAILLENMLTELGHTVVGPVARLGKAVEAAQREAVDVAVLDMNLHGEETYAVAEALAARKIPFVFATGYDRHRLREPYRDGLVLQKPFMLRDLQKAISSLRP